LASATKLQFVTLAVPLNLDQYLVQNGVDMKACKALIPEFLILEYTYTSEKSREKM
jgi:hypothetical protein